MKLGIYAVAGFVLLQSCMVRGGPLDDLLKGAPLDVYICAGQSNMQGARSEKSALPAELQAQQDMVFVFDGTQWTPMNPPDKSFGPEISFAFEMQKALKRPIGIIKHSKGGTNLAKDWSPADPKSLYAQLKRKVDAARESRTINIQGMIWMQGERDSRDEAMASAYQQNLENLIATARRDFGSPEMVFVAGRVNPLYPFVGQVRTAQENCQAAHYFHIDCDDLPKYEDHLHYTTEGQVLLGQRFAKKILK
ncbi:MAG: sialate O-acetylesterase [Kiritimatiellales bacterium]|nr:sialate O-acetylesterase [Kiritimatiellales bacterium]